MHYLVEQEDSRVLLCKDQGKMVLLADVLKYHPPNYGRLPPHNTSIARDRYDIGLCGAL